MRFVALLHERGVYFRAIHFANVLVTGEERFGLIDVSKARFYRNPLHPALRARNFKPMLKYPQDVQAIRTFGWNASLETYLHHANLTPVARRRFLSTIERFAPHTELANPLQTQVARLSEPDRRTHSATHRLGESAKRTRLGEPSHRTPSRPRERWHQNFLHYSPMRKSTHELPARLALADGTILHGSALGALDARAAGEVVFNTAMTGYQEALTDPSYAGQILVMTAPMIGNYGVAREDVESPGGRPQVAGFIVRELSTDRKIAARDARSRQAFVPRGCSPNPNSEVLGSTSTWSRLLPSSLLTRTLAVTRPGHQRPHCCTPSKISRQHDLAIRTHASHKPGHDQQLTYSRRYRQRRGRIIAMINLRHFHTNSGSRQRPHFAGVRGVVIGT